MNSGLEAFFCKFLKKTEYASGSGGKLQSLKADVMGVHFYEESPIGPPWQRAGWNTMCHMSRRRAGHRVLCPLAFLIPKSSSQTAKWRTRPMLFAQTFYM
jgi:hypothetical protein